MGSFGLIFTYLLANDTRNATNPTILRFLATGEMDDSPPPNSDGMWNITDASRILAPAMAYSGRNGPEFWEMIGRTFSILYWLYLADLGQVSAINNLYADVSQSSVPTPINPPATSNIFVNQSLYQNYLNYLQSGQFPFNWTGENPFANFSETLDQPLEPIDTTFLQSYTCQRLQLKTAISLLISIITSDYPFLVLEYTLVLLLASKLEKRRRESKTNLSFSSY